MMQITVTPESLSAEQRSYVADFIRDFPATGADEDAEPLTTIQSFTVPEDDDRTAEEAFANVTEFPTEQTSTLDKAGLPWDARIHTSSRTTNADGTWRRKRGVDAATVTAIETELRAVMAAPAPVPTTTVAVPPPPPVAAPVPVPPTPPATPSPTTYIDLITRASELIMASELTQAQLDAALLAVGVPSLSLLANRLDLAASVMETINQMAATA